MHWLLTSSRSIPSASRLGMTEDSFETFHWGYSCQFGSLPTPGQTSSFGVPSNLAFKYQYRPSTSDIPYWCQLRKQASVTRCGTVLENVQELLHLRVSREKCRGSDQFSCHLQGIQHIYLRGLNSQSMLLIYNVKFIIPNMQPTDHMSTGVE